MIKEDLETLSNYLSNRKDIGWRERKAFNSVVQYFDKMDNRFLDETVYIERMASWIIDHIFELNQDSIKEVSYGFVKNILLTRLSLILKMPSEINYRSLENNILAIDIQNRNEIKKQGSVSEALKMFIKDVIVNSTTKEYETVKD